MGGPRPGRCEWGGIPNLLLIFVNARLFARPKNLSCLIIWFTTQDAIPVLSWAPAVNVMLALSDGQESEVVESMTDKNQESEESMVCFIGESKTGVLPLVPKLDQPSTAAGAEEAGRTCKFVVNHVVWKDPRPSTQDLESQNTSKRRVEDHQLESKQGNPVVLDDRPTNVEQSRNEKKRRDHTQEDQRSVASGQEDWGDRFVRNLE